MSTGAWILIVILAAIAEVRSVVSLYTSYNDELLRRKPTI